MLHTPANPGFYSTEGSIYLLGNVCISHAVKESGPYAKSLALLKLLQAEVELVVLLPIQQPLLGSDTIVDNFVVQRRWS